MINPFRAAPKVATAAVVITLLTAIFLFAVSTTRADVIQPCALPKGVASKSLQNGAPSAVLQALEEHIGEIVPPGAKFDATDIVVTGRNRREIFVWNVGRRRVVATEHGGRGYNNPIFAYDLS